MDVAKPIRTLIAAPQRVIDVLGRALHELPVEIYPGPTTRQADLLAKAPLDLILVCYVFDDLRPYAFIRRVRNEPANEHTPIALIRALPVPLGGSEESQIRQAYRTIGADEFLNYSQLSQDRGPASADAALRECVSKLVGVWL